MVSASTQIECWCHIVHLIDARLYCTCCSCFPIDWCLFARSNASARAQAAFFAHLEFHFVSTDSDDIFEVRFHCSLTWTVQRLLIMMRWSTYVVNSHAHFCRDCCIQVKIVYDNQLIKFARISLAMLLEERGDPAKQKAAATAGVPYNCDIIKYDPQGDRVPVVRVQTFVFNKYVQAA